VPGHLGPTIDRDFSVLCIQSNHHMAWEGITRIVQESGGLHGSGPDDYITDAVIEVALHRVQIPDAPAKLYRNSVSDGLDDRLDGLFVAGLARECAVQVHQVQSARALCQPMPRHCGGIVREDGGLIHSSLLQAHAMAVLQVDGRNNQHARSDTGQEVSGLGNSRCTEQAMQSGEVIIQQSQKPLHSRVQHVMADSRRVVPGGPA